MIYTIAPSPKVAGEIWVGTDDGLVHLTRDEGKDVERRDAAGSDAVEQSDAYDGVALRSMAKRTRRWTGTGSKICSHISTERRISGKRGSAFRTGFRMEAF